jgi:hypothetical protein
VLFAKTPDCVLWPQVRYVDLVDIVSPHMSAIREGVRTIGLALASCISCFNISESVRGSHWAVI